MILHLTDVFAISFFFLENSIPISPKRQSNERCEPYKPSRSRKLFWQVLTMNVKFNAYNAINTDFSSTREKLSIFWKLIGFGIFISWWLSTAANINTNRWFPRRSSISRTLRKYSEKINKANRACLRFSRDRIQIYLLWIIDEDFKPDWIYLINILWKQTFSRLIRFKDLHYSFSDFPTLFRKFQKTSNSLRHVRQASSQKL